jgi:hypothetical protein
VSGKTITRYVLKCDGECGTERGANGEYENAMEARAAAYADGWRFPSKTTMNGKTSAQSCDVCPECLPTFDPTSVPPVDPWKNRRETKPR